MLVISNNEQNKFDIIEYEKYAYVSGELELPTTLPPTS